jgi:hypothetical protein
MVFSDATNNSGIVQEIDSLCSSTTTSYPLKDKARRCNTALEFLIGKILNADGTWQWDDPNHSSNLPIGTGDLVAGQSSYTFADTFLDIENVKVRDASGSWHFLQPIDQSQIDIPLEDFLTDNGLPIYYDKLGDTMKIYPAPDADDVYAGGNNIKVQFKRTAHLFESTDTTTVPGIASPYHYIIPYMAAIPYCMAHKKDRVALYEKKVDEGIKDMIAFYSHREKDKRKIMTMGSISFR